MTDSVASQLSSAFDWSFGVLERSTASPAPPPSWSVLIFAGLAGYRIYAGNAERHVLVGDIGRRDDPTPELRDAIRKLEPLARSADLRLEPDLVLERALDLPSSARDVLDKIVENQMEVYLPWPLAEAVMHHRIVEMHDAPGTRIRVEVVAAPRRVIDHAAGIASALGLTISEIDCGPSPVAQRTHLFQSTRAADRRGRSRRHARISLLCAAVGSAVGALALPGLIGARTEIEAASSEIAARRVELEGVSREGGSPEHAAWRSLAAEKLGRLPAVKAIDALSAALPDHAWLDRLKYDGQRWELGGYAKGADRLIRELEATGVFEDARFAGPTAHDASTGIEAFSLTLREAASLSTTARP